MARLTVAADEFNREGGPLGGNWEDLITATPFLIVNSVARATSVIAGSAARWRDAVGPNQGAGIEIRSLGNLSTDFWSGVILRASADLDAGRDFYVGRVFENSAGPNYTTEISVVQDSTITVLHSAAMPWVIGDRLELEADGSILRMFRNGTPLGGSFTLTDTTLSSGQPGIFSGSNSSTNGILDNFQAWVFGTGGAGRAKYRSSEKWEVEWNGVVRTFRSAFDAEEWLDEQVSKHNRELALARAKERARIAARIKLDAPSDFRPLVNVFWTPED